MRLMDRVINAGCRVHPIYGDERVVIGVVGDGTSLDKQQIGRMKGVENVVPISKPYKQASREFHPTNTIIQVGHVSIGGDEVVMMAGPCSVEGREHLIETAFACREMGAQILRGGAYKPRSSPYSFQGLGGRGVALFGRGAGSDGDARDYRGDGA
jgi:3-deoxy-7-phosphoheptulonate synthase